MARRRNLGLGAWDFDPMSGEWVDTGSVDNSGRPTFTVTTTSTALDTGADHGLPGKAPCDLNSLYPAGHRCAVRQQYIDAQNVIRVVQTATAPGGIRQITPSSPTVTQQLNAAGAQVASWISANAGIAAIGVVGLVVLLMTRGRSKGGRR
jgi:hypothetical protein